LVLGFVATFAGGSGSCSGFLAAPAPNSENVGRAGGAADAALLLDSRCFAVLVRVIV
jgi:hypothetical protein